MSPFRRLATLSLGVLMAGFTSAVVAHDPGEIGPSDGMMVTRHFTGLWDQVDQEAQGISLQVIEQSDDSRKALAYWYTYGDDHKTAWYLGIGELVDNRIELELYDSAGAGFMQPAAPGNDSVHVIGTMTITFQSCTGGTVEFATSHPEVGAGSFRIQRLTEIMNTYCTGNLADDVSADAMYGEQRIGLQPARTGVTGIGHARLEILPGQMNLLVEAEGLPDGTYRVFAGMVERGEFVAHQGYGELKFSSPAEDGHMLLNFDPHGMLIEIHDDEGVVLSAFNDRFDAGHYGHAGYGSGYGEQDHYYDCAMMSGPGHGMHDGMGGGMTECVEDGDFVEIDAELINTGVFPAARGRAEWEMNAHRVRFSVEIEDVPEGTYSLRVGGTPVGLIEAYAMPHGEVYGHTGFRDPEAFGSEPLDFEPRGQRIEVLQQDSVVLAVDFPAE